jgi:hypothetical protein
MCLICDQLDSLVLTPWEAKRNLQETADELSVEHVIEVMKKLEEME